MDCWKEAVPVLKLLEWLVGPILKRQGKTMILIIRRRHA